MDEETREAAIHKARAITDMIGFPEFILDKNQVSRSNSTDLRILRFADLWTNPQISYIII
jgi:predicted metalloendopeptidase